MDIVTCSRKEGDAKEMFASFKDTIPKAKLHEIVAAPTIAEGYNQGLKQCSQDIIVFTHSDIRNMASVYAFERALLFLEEKPAIGFAGVAGTAILEQNGVWWQEDAQKKTDALRGAITHENPKTHQIYQSVYGNGLVETPVVALDGAILIAFRKTLKDINFKFWSHGFHYYDIDASLQMHLANRTNYVVDIPLLHFSTGEMDKTWHEARAAFLDKYRNALPVHVRAGKESTIDR